MTEINWSPYVNTTVYRDGADWQEPVKIIEDRTRSGKQKRRYYASNTKRTFNIKMKFSMVEYEAFRNWFENTIRSGMYSFMFPQIDSISKPLKEYRISASGFPKYSNITADKIQCTMVLEEV